ncbi:MAG: hypothetical protein K0Q91_1161 [Fibrobacteria bacterium]|jgi:hypothetical protein|nr:hypothetical protein [Fibrobacteria bacterium]
MALFDYFRPQWKHSNPAQRLAAMRLLEGDRQDVFLAAALEDEDSPVRAAAARRLEGEARVRQVLAKTADKAVQEVLWKNLTRILAEKARSAGAQVSGEEAEAWVSELRGLPAGEKILEDLACHSPSLILRKQALDALTHAGAVLAVALKEEDTTLALEALARLSRDAHLQAVARGAANRAARQGAKERLRTREDAKRPDEAALNRAKLHILMGAVEKADAGSAEPAPGFAWDAAREQVEEAGQALEQLLNDGLAVAPDLRARFEASRAAFLERHARHVASEAARRERDLHEQHNRLVQLEVCARLEALYADASPVDAEEIDSLARRFNGAEIPGENPLRERFRIARERLVKEKLRKQREQEETERRRTASESAQKRREELVAEAEALKASGREKSDPAFFAARVGALPREWKDAFAGTSEADATLEARFTGALAALEDLKAGARAEGTVRLEAWIGELESLANAPDLKLAEKRAKEIAQRAKGLLALVDPEGGSRTLRYHAAADHLRETLDWNRWANLQRKQDICARLEALQTEAQAEEADVRSLFGRFKDLNAEWKSVGPVPWDSSEALWDRYHQTSDALYEKCREHFAELDVEREANFKTKEELCARLEAIVAGEEIDWREATEAFKEAHSSWKAIGAVPQEKSEALWERFRAVGKAFYDRRDGNHKENLRAKQELAAQAERLGESREWKTAAAQIKELQEKWKTIGPVARDKSEALWNRFHGACEAFFRARGAYFDQLDQERPLNLEKKTALCELVENLDALETDKERYERILDAQAQWKEIGPVPREVEDSLWERFRKPLDAYFQNHRARLEAERGQREEGARVKRELCAEAEALRDSTEWKSTIEKIKDLQARWKASPPAPRAADQELWQRFRAACDAFFERLKEHSAGRDQDREGNLRRKEDLCFAVEIYSGLEPSDPDARAERAAWIETQLAGGFGVPEASDDWRKTTDKVKALQQEWRAIGPVPRERNNAVWDRFQRACDAFFEERRRALGLPEEDPQANLESKLALVADAEELAQSPGAHHEDSIARLRGQWKRIGPVPRAQSDYVWDRFNDACNTAVPRELRESRESREPRGPKGPRRSEETAEWNDNRPRADKPLFGKL